MEHTQDALRPPASASPASESQPSVRGRMDGRTVAGVLSAFFLAELLAGLDLTVSPTLAFLSPGVGQFMSATWAGSFCVPFVAPLPLNVRRASALVALLCVALCGVWMENLLAPLPLLGLAGIALQCAFYVRSADRQRARDALLTSLLLPMFVSASGAFLTATAILWPRTWDAYTFQADALLFGQVSFWLGQLFDGSALVFGVLQLVYHALPLAFATVIVLHFRASSVPGPSPLAVFLRIAMCGYAVYFAFPVAGPRFAFPMYPSVPPTPALAAMVAEIAPRNCVPSLHTAWALAAFHLSAPYGRIARAGNFIFLCATLLATLATGLHYVIDLVVAFPFTTAVIAGLSADASLRGSEARHIWQRQSALFIGWLVCLRFALPYLPRFIFCTLAIASVAAAAFDLRRLTHLDARALRQPQVVRATPARASSSRETWSISAIFFISGFAALCYEVVFAKAFAVSFGSTARASTNVLVVYMAGLALGAYLGGRWATRVQRPLVAFALVELGVAALCALFPTMMLGVRSAYDALASGSEAGALWLIPLQTVFQALAVLPATLLMGATLPLLARHLSRADAGVGRAVAELYWVNTAGAALGSLVAGYVFLPILGVTQTVYCAVLLELLVAFVAFRLSQRAITVAAVSQERADCTLVPIAEAGRSAHIAVPMIALFLGGVVTFALETVYVHLLAVVVGNSVYAFSLMVSAFLVGIAAGASLGKRWLEGGTPLARHICTLYLALAAILLLSLSLWDAVPAHFASYDGYPLGQSFAARELVRFVCAALLLIPPAAVIGASYPLAMAWVGAAARGESLPAIGRASALNTLGNIVGAVLGGFLLVPAFGSFRAIEWLAALSASVALGVWYCADRHPLVLVRFVVPALLFAQLPADFDYTRLASGANVYFREQLYGNVIDHAESADGGLTTIAESLSERGRRVITMLTNGKFQGDDSRDREMKAQYSFSMLPLLHGEARRRALIIGLGTGVSARVAVDAGYAEVHVAELSQDVVRLAGRYFSEVNRDALKKSNVRVHVTDGRNLLALSDVRFDLISAEVSSIWFAGAANLYNREYYEAARDHMSEQGVLAQWVQIHRLSQADIATIVATARAVFPRVWLYFVPNQATLIACMWDCSPSRASVARMTGQSSLADALADSGGVSAMLASRILAPTDAERFIAFHTARLGGVEELLSSDDNLRLEYSTPAANTRPYERSLRQNLEHLDKFRSQDVRVGTRLSALELHQLEGVSSAN